MQVNNRTWKIATIAAKQDVIEHQPIYQRGDVWTRDAQKLLIDSILREYDIPKIYLRHLAGNRLYEYQVVDGQQRLTAIWSYINDDYTLLKDSGTPKAWAGKKFSDLDKKYRDRILDFPLVFAVIERATDDDVRELFARLQKGTQLNPAELRNSYRSVLGREVRAIATSHPFFIFSSFSSKRYAYHNLTAHAFAAQCNGTSSDMKAADLKQLYEKYKDSCPRSVSKSVVKSLDYLRDMINAHAGCIGRKWGFVDLCMVITQANTSIPAASVLAKRYVAFEATRLAYVSRPEDLLIPGSNYDSDLYDYIMAFKLSPGEKNQLKTRHNVLHRRLIGNRK